MPGEALVSLLGMVENPRLEAKGKFVSFHPHQHFSKTVQWLKGTSSRVLLQEFSRLRKQLWVTQVWARGYPAVSSGTIKDKMVEEYIAGQECEPIHDDSQFVIGEDMKLPPSRR